MGVKKIIIGEIKEETKYDTPIELLKWAIQLSQKDDFCVYTNNPQLVEVFQVLCDGENVKVYLQLDGKCVEIGFEIAYAYLGEVYHILDFLIQLYSQQLTKIENPQVNNLCAEFIEHLIYLRKLDK